MAFALSAGLSSNKANAFNNNTYPDAVFIYKPTNWRLSPALSYQHNTSYGFIYGGSIQFGVYKRDVTIRERPYDTVAHPGINIFGFSDKSYYLGLNAFIGYYYCLTPKTTKPFYVEGKIGITKRYYFSGDHFEGDPSDFRRVFDSTFNVYQPTYIIDKWGNERNFPTFFDGYIGIRKQVDWICKNTFINLGAYCAFQFELPGSSIEDNAETVVKSGVYKQGVFQYWDYDYYYNRELTFGIRAGFGLSF